MWQLLTSSTNISRETFMTITIIHSLQGFHIHYKIYVVEKRIEILLCLFFLFYKISYTLRRLKGENLREKILTIKNKVSYLIWRMKFWKSLKGKQMRSFSHV